MPALLGMVFFTILGFALSPLWFWAAGFCLFLIFLAAFING